MESTGIYGENLAYYLHESGQKVSIVNPARIKAYTCSESIRNKTDKFDCGVIARFCKSQNPYVWRPASPEERELKEFYRCLQNLKQDHLRISNRLEKVNIRKTDCSKIWNELLKAIDKKIRSFVKRNETLRCQVDLLKTIPGVREKTAVAILSELPNVRMPKKLLLLLD
jgi:transposase